MGACMAGDDTCVARGLCMARGHEWQGACMAGGMHACMAGGHACQCVCMAGEMAIAVDSMHPTGMHSCPVYGCGCTKRQ